MKIMDIMGSTGILDLLPVKENRSGVLGVLLPGAPSHLVTIRSFGAWPLTLGYRGRMAPRKKNNPRPLASDLGPEIDQNQIF